MSIVTSFAIAPASLYAVRSLISAVVAVVDLHYQPVNSCLSYRLL